MANTATSSPDTISDSEFHEFFARYPALIAEISDAKGGRHIPFRALRSSGHPAAASDNPTFAAKPGQETLASLDQYRYGTALDTFGSENPGTGMDLDHVKRLVEWKLYVSLISCTSSTS